MRPIGTRTGKLLKGTSYGHVLTSLGYPFSSLAALWTFAYEIKGIKIQQPLFTETISHIAHYQLIERLFSPIIIFSLANPKQKIYRIQLPVEQFRQKYIKIIVTKGSWPLTCTNMQYNTTR